MKLLDVYTATVDNSHGTLWELLGERTPEQSISHRSMPTWEQHCTFVDARPYECWYLIADARWIVGACYLTKQREIGVSIFRAHHRQGHASRAVAELMRLNPGRFLANINPANEASIALFRKLGFGGPIQITLEKP